MSIAILDYDIGNVRSISEAFKKHGAEVFLTRNKFDILESDGLVIPGVGSFSHGMKSLSCYGLIEIIKEFSELNKPILGICLGMQLLFDESYEYGKTQGLSLLKGKVIKIPTKNSQSEKLPHVSWNEIYLNEISWNNTILSNIDNGSEMYFVHSYVAEPEDTSQILSITEYSKNKFCSSIKKGNIYGCQFHPEKSGTNGLRLILNFINICQL